MLVRDLSDMFVLPFDLSGKAGDVVLSPLWQAFNVTSRWWQVVAYGATLPFSSNAANVPGIVIAKNRSSACAYSRLSACACASLRSIRKFIKLREFTVYQNVVINPTGNAILARSLSTPRSSMA